MKANLPVGKLLAGLALAFGLSTLVPGTAGAAALSFDDTSPADTITVSACDFEGGAVVNGVGMGSCGVGFGGSVTVPEAGTVVFTGTWITLGLQPSTTRTIFLVEAGTPNLISDILAITIVDNQDGTASIQAVFLSDSESNLGLLPIGVNPADVFVENGLPVEFGFAFLSGSVISDVDAVPEPGSLALLGLGLGLLPLRRLVSKRRR